MTLIAKTESSTVTGTSGRWPDFVGIGAIKAGTTWLHTCLTEHPGVFSPPTKEIQFFNDRFDKGEDWYRGLFAEAPPETCCGEFTPGYMHDPVAIDRMGSLPETCGFLVCLRNPVDRAFSHFMMNLRDSTTTEPAQKLALFAKAVHENDHPVIRNGFYRRQLAPYYDRFGKERIRCILFDDIKERPLDVLRTVHGFLGIDPRFVPPSADRVINPAVRYRSARLFRWMRYGVQTAERSFLAPVVVRLKINGFRDRVLAWWRRPESALAMDSDTRDHLESLYAPANRDLERLTGLDLSRWQTRV